MENDKKNSPISEHISQAEDLVVSKRVEVEEIANVNIFHTELIGFATIMSAASLIIIYLYSLNLEANVSVLNTTIELCVSIDEVDGGYVMGNK